MKKTEIRILFSTTSPNVKSRKYGYILDHKGRTRDGFGIVDGSYHAAVLQVIIKALNRYQQSSEISISIPDEFILNMIKNIETWEENGYMTKHHKPVANADLWKELAAAMKKHKISMSNEPSSYDKWLLSEIEKR